MLKGFKEFLFRGNVIDLAVAVIIGAAFTAIVTALVNGIFNPVIALIFQADDIAKAGIPIGDTGQTLGFGLVIAAIINFVLVAAVVYFALVLPMNYAMKKMAERRGTAEPEAPAGPTDNDLLLEIRDLLAAQNGVRPGGTTPPAGYQP